MVARSVARPLEALETAMARLRDGDFDTREPVSATDEIGAVAEGFNLLAGRLSESYAALEARNRELAEALDRVCSSSASSTASIASFPRPSAAPSRRTPKPRDSERPRET
jgi:methyl-accepting chemotaxis protein